MVMEPGIRGYSGDEVREVKNRARLDFEATVKYPWSSA